MLILTTIYFAELKNFDSVSEPEKTRPFQPGVAKSRRLIRELVSLYEGKNRVLPIE